jgi:competence protein ComEC
MKRLMAALLPIVAAGAALLAAQGKNTKPLEIWVVDVEGGKAALYVSPTGQTALIDTGFPGARDHDRIMAAIADAGVKQIDYLVSTHYHVDHIGGLTELATKIPILNYVDHGPTVEGPNVPQIPPGPDGLTLTKPREQIEGFQAAYAELYGKAKRIVVKPGDRVPITGLEWRIATAAGNVLKTPLPGGGKPNPACANFTPLPTNEGMVVPDDFH